MGEDGTGRPLRWAQIGCFLLYTLLVVFVSLTPSDASITLAGWDKVGHFGAYGVMVVLAFLTFRSTNGRLLILLLILLLGFSLELLQGLVPGRLASWQDGLANSLGVGVGTAVFATLSAHLIKIYDGLWELVGEKVKRGE